MTLADVIAYTREQAKGWRDAEMDALRRGLYMAADLHRARAMVLEQHAADLTDWLRRVA